jgi:hypothetical protein
MKLWIDEGNGFNEVASVSSGTVIEYDYYPNQTSVIYIRLTGTVNGEDLEENLKIQHHCRKKKHKLKHFLMAYYQA